MSSNGDKRRAWLGLGGNIGDVKTVLQEAIDLLRGNDGVELIEVSPLYKTPPWGVEDQPWFLNCCVEVSTTASPEELLEICQEAERQGKRQRTVRWGPRTIDIDIIAFEGIDQVEQRLTIPHPRATQRAFVMVPLADIAPELKLSGKTIQEWAKELDADGLQPASDTNDWWTAKGNAQSAE